MSLHPPGFEVGAKVRLKTRFPRHGLGAVNKGAVGVITELGTLNSPKGIYVDFKVQRAWMGYPEEFDIVERVQHTNESALSMLNQDEDDSWCKI